MKRKKNFYFKFLLLAVLLGISLVFIDNNSKSEKTRKVDSLEDKINEVKKEESTKETI